MTNGKQVWMAERIDRSREAPRARAERAARASFLRMTARRLILSALADLTDPAEKAGLLGYLIDVAAEQRHPIIGRVETATGLNKVAADICAIFRLDRAVKSAAAEQSFARMTKAANDRGAT